MVVLSNPCFVVRACIRVTDQLHSPRTSSGHPTWSEADALEGVCLMDFEVEAASLQENFASRDIWPGPGDG